MSEKIIKKVRIFFKNNWQIAILVAVALLVRFYFLDKYISVSGDLLLFADWGEKYWVYGSKSYYFISNWYYAPPNYPPLINLYYAYAYKAFEYKYLIATLHNLIRIPPAFFIVYYYKFGYFINLKILAIICDILSGLLVYKFVRVFTKNRKLAFFSGSLFLFNPSVVILSSIWGQTDSVIAILSIISFILLVKGRFVFSSLLITIGLLFKPNWVVFIPLYLFLYFTNRPKLKYVLVSLVTVLILLIIVSLPFSDNPFKFYSWLIQERILSTLNASPHASVSAFNFYTTFLRIDHDLSMMKIIGVPVKLIGQFLFSGVYLYCLIYLQKSKASLENLLKAILIIGMGSFLFLPGMLERYFFPSLIPFAILSVKYKKLLILYFTFAITFGLNIIWALFRRSNGDINDFFSANNFLVVKLISIHNVIGFILIFSFLFRDNLLKLSLWKKLKAIWTPPLK